MTPARLVDPFSAERSSCLAWRFCLNFADVLELWPFTLDEFVQGFHDYVRGSIPLLWEQIVDLSYKPQLNIIYHEETQGDEGKLSAAYAAEMQKLPNSIASPAAPCLAALKPKLPAQTIAALSEHVEPADTIIDGDFQPKICYHPRQGEGSRPHLRIPGRRISEVSDSQVAASPHLRGLRFPGRRISEVSGGEDGARNCGNSQVKGEQKTEQKMVMVNKVLKMKI
nr:phosphoinositide phosphatase SAC8 isoform X2 [Ipomoea batatas]